MILVNLKPENIEAAQVQSTDLGVLNKSITSGKGNLAGFLGEIAVCQYFNTCQNNTFDYDVVVDNITYDIRSKFCTSEPSPTYFASVASVTKKQTADRYLFTRVEHKNRKPTGRVWLMGWIETEKYYEMATHYEKGEVDPASFDNWRFKEPCWNLRYSKLNKMEDLKIAQRHKPTF